MDDLIKELESILDADIGTQDLSVNQLNNLPNSSENQLNNLPNYSDNQLNTVPNYSHNPLNNLPNYSDNQLNHILQLKKRIILTDEILRKFNVTLEENEKLKEEKIKYIEELQNCRQILFSHLTKDEDRQKKCIQLETRLCAIQQELDLQINLVAARDSVAHQYVSLIKEKDEEIKKLKEENQSFKKNKDCDKADDKKLKKKYNAILKRSNKLSEILEKLQTCSDCQLLKSSIKIGKKKVKNECDLDDLGSFSPQNSVPASVCSIDTGFESNLSDSDTDTDNVNVKKKLPKKLGVEKKECVVFSENENKNFVVQTSNEKCKIPSKLLLNNDGVEILVTVSEDNVISETVEHSSEYEESSTQCSCHLKGAKETAEKYVQTRIVKYVDFPVQVSSDVVSKSVQTEEMKLKSDELQSNVLSKSIQTIPIIVEDTPEYLTSKLANKYSNETIPSCNVSCQTQIREWHYNVGSQTDMKGSQTDNSTQTDEDTLCDITEYCDAFSPAPSLLSPLPPSPFVDDSESLIEMDEENIFDDSSSASDEDVSVKSMSHSTIVRPRYISSVTTQTDDNYCLCRRLSEISHSNAAVQCDGSDIENLLNLENNGNKTPYNKYGIKRREESAGARNTPYDKEEFWKKLVLWLISNDGPSLTQKTNIIDLLQDRNISLPNKTELSSFSEGHSSLGMLGTSQLQSTDYHESSICNTWSAKSSPAGLSVKPIVVEMNSSHESLGLSQNEKFQFSLKNIGKQSGDVKDHCENIVNMKKKRRIAMYQHTSARNEVRNFKKIMKSPSAKLSGHQKTYRSVRVGSLKRKLGWSADLDVSDTSSGSFTVSSIPACNRGEQSIEREVSNFLPNSQVHCEHDIQNSSTISETVTCCSCICTSSSRTAPFSRRVIENLSIDENDSVSPDSSKLHFPSPLISQPRQSVMRSLTPSLLDSSNNMEVQSVLDRKSGSVEINQTAHDEFYEVKHPRNDINSQDFNVVSDQNVETRQFNHHQNTESELSPTICHELETTDLSNCSTILLNKEQPLTLDVLESCSPSVSAKSREKSVFLSSETAVDSHCKNSRHTDINYIPRKIKRYSHDSRDNDFPELCSTNNVVVADNLNVSDEFDPILQTICTKKNGEKSKDGICAVVQSDHQFPSVPSLKRQSHVSERINSHENGQCMLPETMKLQRKNDSCSKNAISDNWMYTQKDVLTSNVKNASSEILGSDSDDTESQLFVSSNKTESSQILKRDLNLDHDYSDSDSTESNSHEGSCCSKTEVEIHNMSKNTSQGLCVQKNASECSSESHFVAVVDNSQKSSSGLKKSNEYNPTNVITSMQGNDVLKLNNDKRVTEKVQTNAKFKKQSDVISERPSLNVPELLETNPQPQALIHKTKERLEEFSKPSKDILVTDSSHLKHSLTISQNKKLSYRKYCESTISDMVVVKPPPVENDIALKRMIKDTVRASGLIPPVKAREKNAPSNVSPQILTKNTIIQNPTSSETKLESIPFHRRGMTGRRKMVVSGASSASPEKPKPIESTENECFSESLRKQQRTAHTPRLNAIASKRNIEESSCDESSAVHESPGRDTLKLSKRPQKPPIKRSKLQKLKQQCITQRKRIQSLTCDNSQLRSSTEVVAKEQREDEPVEGIDKSGAKSLLTLTDIALDMALSDSDESINSKNKLDEKCENVSLIKSGTVKQSSIRKDVLNDKGDHSKQSHKKLELLESSNQECKIPRKICNKLLPAAENFARVAESKEPLTKHVNLESKEKANSHGSSLALNHKDDVTTNSTYTLCELTPENKNILNQSPGHSKETSSVHLVPNFTKDIQQVTMHTTEEKMIDSENECKKDEDDTDMLESPMSPPSSPNMSNCESFNHVPLIIPTSPQTQFIENSNKETNSKFSLINMPENMSSNDDLQSGEEEEYDDGDDDDGTEDSAVNTANGDDSGDNDCDDDDDDDNEDEKQNTKEDKNIKLDVPENNMKSKLRSWYKKVKTDLNDCEESNILKEYFHHYKEEEMKRKETKKSASALKRYTAKKKNIELLFDEYLSGEFTETSLSDTLEKCKKLLGGDYGIIAKYIVKCCKYSSNEEYDYTKNYPMNPTQQRLFTFVIKLEKDHPTIVNEVLERIERVVCNITHHRFLETLQCLARFFIAFCKLRNNKHRAQIFCYDALNCLKLRAHTVLFAVLTAFPECFPKADSPASDSPIVKAMVHVVFTYGKATFTVTKNLRTYLSNYYGYKRENLLAEELLKHFMEELKSGMVPEVEQAVLLMAKFKGDWTWKHEKIIKNCLLPIIESWRNGHTNETIVASSIKLCAYLAKSPPYEKSDTLKLMTLFENLLFLNTSPSKIKEACIFSLAVLINIDVGKVIRVLKRCNSEAHLQNSELRSVLSVVMRKRNCKWWSKCLRI